MFFRSSILATFVSIFLLFLSACTGSSSPDIQKENALKQFPAPNQGMAGVYLYRSSILGLIFNRDMFVNGKCIGRPDPYTFYYVQLPGDKEYIFSTEGDIGFTSTKLYLESGKNYFLDQDYNIGVFMPPIIVPASTDLEKEDTQTGKNNVLQATLGKNPCSLAELKGYAVDFPQFEADAELTLVTEPSNLKQIRMDALQSEVKVSTISQDTNKTKEQATTTNEEQTVVLADTP